MNKPLKSLKFSFKVFLIKYLCQFQLVIFFLFKAFITFQVIHNNLHLNSNIVMLW